MVCLQRWWRCRTGLVRRLAFVNDLMHYARVLDSRTLFMEADVYFTLTQKNPELIRSIDERARVLGLGFCFDHENRVQDKFESPAITAYRSSRSSVGRRHPERADPGVNDANDYLLQQRNLLRLPTVVLETCATEVHRKCVELEGPCTTG